MSKPNPGTAKSSDALALLKADHELVQELFDKFDTARTDKQKADLAEQICTELTIHAQIEEEIFYPAVRKAIEEDDLMDEATVEHESAKHLIGELEGMHPGDELFDARFTVLGEYVKHHIREEQREIFPLAKRAKMDLDELGEQMLQRKKELGG